MKDTALDPESYRMWRSSLKIDPLLVKHVPLEFYDRDMGEVAIFSAKNKGLAVSECIRLDDIYLWVQAIKDKEVSIMDFPVNSADSRFYQVLLLLWYFPSALQFKKKVAHSRFSFIFLERVAMFPSIPETYKGKVILAKSFEVFYQQGGGNIRSLLNL